MSFEDVKYQVAIANRILAETGLASGILSSVGHASMRVPDDPDRFIVKGRGYTVDALVAMEPSEMVICDLDGFLVEAPPNVSQCFEVKLHSCIYKTHPEVQSVVHVHPRFTVLMSVLQLPIRPMCQEGMHVIDRPIPVYPHVAIVQTDEQGMEVAALLGDSPAILLEGHGAATTGPSLQQAVLHMLWLEEHARLTYQAVCAMGPDHRYISSERIAEHVNRAPALSLPHFAESMKTMEHRNGFWEYYSRLVARDL